MTANFSSSKGLSRSNTPPLPPAFAVGLNMYSSSSFSVARATTLHAGDDDDDCEEDWKETKLFVFALLLIKPKEEEEVDLEEEEVEEEDEMRPAAATVEDAAIVNILYSFCDVLSELFCLLSK